MVSLALLPAEDVLKGWQSIADALTWASLGKDGWRALAASLGDAELNDLVLFAAVDPLSMRGAIQKMALPIEKAKAALVYNAVRVRFGMEIADVQSEKVPAEADVNAALLQGVASVQPGRRRLHCKTSASDTGYASNMASLQGDATATDETSEEDARNMLTWPVSRLRAECQARNLDMSQCLEKTELVSVLLGQVDKGALENVVGETENCQHTNDMLAMWTAGPDDQSEDEHFKDDNFIEQTEVRDFNGKECSFKKVTLLRLFDYAGWDAQVWIASSSYSADCRSLIKNAATMIGAHPSEDNLTGAEQHQVERLKRLEARFKGRGVHEGEAQNALRLFERELARAQWTPERFETLKGQLDGKEAKGVADITVKVRLRSPPEVRGKGGSWFRNACSRIAAPLGLVVRAKTAGNHYVKNWSFIGPLGTALGAALTSSLIFHLGFLDFQRLNGSDINAFMHGFVNGCLDAERALIWKQIFQIEDDEEARRFVELQGERGFFGGADAGESNEDAGESNGDAGDSNVATGSAEEPSRARRSRSDAGNVRDFISNVLGHSAMHESEERQSTGQTEQPTFTPFSGTGHHLGDDSSPSELAVVIAENIATMRNLRVHNQIADREMHNEREESSDSEGKRRRRHAKRREQEHCAEAMRTQSYSVGLDAGRKRKAEVDIRGSQANKSAKLHHAIEN